MTGLTSYPRTGSPPPASIVQLYQQIHALQAAQPGLDALALAAVATLEALSAMGTAHAVMVQLARDLRNALWVAKSHRANAGACLARTMGVCALHWSAEHPLHGPASRFAPGAAAALAAHAASGTHVELKRAASEAAGSLAALYALSALLGEDLHLSHLGTASALGGSHYVGAYDAGNALVYLESAASYNVNLFVRVDIPNVPDPLILVAEAKGGASGYASVTGPPALAAGGPISQKDHRYALSRAHYMLQRGRVPATPQAQARREAGRAIRDAVATNRLAYVTARGVIDNGRIIARREHFECL